MGITAYWKTTTGFNVTDYPVTLGKPVNQCSNAELKAHPMCGSISPYNNVAYSVAVDDTVGGNGSRIGYLTGSPGFTYPIITGHSEEWTVGPNPSDDIRKQYRRTIFVACPTNVSMPARCITDQCNSGILIVENITDPNKLVQLFGNTPSSGSYVAFTTSISTACRHTCQRGQSAYSSAPNQLQYTDPDTQTTTNYYVYPVWYYEYDEVSYLFREEYHESFGGVYRAGEPDEHNYNYITCNSSYRASFSTTTPYVLAMGYNPNAADEARSLIDVVGRSAYADPVPDPAQFITTPLDFPTYNLAPDGAGVVVGLTMSNSTQSGYRVCTLNMQLWAGNEWYRAPAFCRAGTYFVNNGELLKPIIKDGIVIGYGSTDAESEIDGYTDLNHPVPSGPGGGGGSVNDEDNKDPVNTAGAPFAAGLCNYYAMTAGSPLLGHISEALGAWDIANTSKDLYKNLISCKLIKPPAPIPTTGSAPFTIYGVKPQYAGADISLPVVSGNPDATFGPYQISRKFNDFRDYSPYTRVSIYLPYCGWCDLPSHVVGRSVSVHYYTDIIAATCKAVVFCNNNIIAEAAGVIGLDIPFAADNVGAKMQAVTAGMIAALGGGIQLGAGIGTMVSTKSGNGAKSALAGASQYLSGYSQMAMAFNENTTEISGKNGDGCCLSGATNIIIKIVRPKKGAYTDAPYVPPGYGHNVGFVSQKQVKVSSVSGLLIADNVDTSGISGATEAERAEIKRVLETGLIINSPPE